MKLHFTLFCAGVVLSFGCKRVEPGSPAIPSTVRRPEITAAEAPARASRKATNPLPGLPGVFFRAVRATQLDVVETEHVNALEAKLGTTLADGDGRPEFERFQRDLVDSIRARAIDTATLAADESAFEKADFAMREKQIDAIRQIHDLLEPSTRRQVADAIRESMKQSYARTPHSSPATANDAAQERNARRADEMSAELELDDAQRRQLSVLLSRRDGADRKPDVDTDRAAQRQMESILVEFEKEVFSTGNVDLSPVARTPVESMANEVLFVERLLPSLRPRQVSTLADLMARGNGLGLAEKRKTG